MHNLDCAWRRTGIPDLYFVDVAALEEIDVHQRLLETVETTKQAGKHSSYHGVGKSEGLSGIDVNTNGNEEDGDESKEDEGVDKDGDATCLLV
ncbi:hypothetical protein Nepgr_029268 [Nepenthes gracilis]|uniref:Uncharacterized protein n=1 Tax=Nepenthes gracilis TaxID=150966 RepID=A0AAD3TC55_NEPGR|nr:hypothetical protein Nepgr_029268 [Nepenthes gracilis]